MALGRGLGAILGDSALHTQEGGSVTLPLDQVEPGLNQPRKNFNQEALEELTESIRLHGVLQPLVVRRLASGKYQIIAGERRWRASKLAGRTDVPAVIIEADDRLVMEIGLIENLQRQDLNPMEEAAGYRTLIQDYGLTQEETAKRVSKSRPAIANAMRLLALPGEAQALIEAGKVSAGHGRALLTLADPAHQIDFARQAADQGWSVRETEERIRKFLETGMVIPEDKKNPDPLRHYFKEAEKSLTKNLGRRVTISQGKKKGKLTLEYYNLEDLEGLLNALKDLPGREA